MKANIPEWTTSKAMSTTNENDMRRYIKDACAATGEGEYLYKAFETLLHDTDGFKVDYIGTGSMFLNFTKWFVSAKRDNETSFAITITNYVAGKECSIKFICLIPAKKILANGEKFITYSDDGISDIAKIKGEEAVNVAAELLEYETVELFKNVFYEELQGPNYRHFYSADNSAENQLICAFAVPFLSVYDPLSPKELFCFSLEGHAVELAIAVDLTEKTIDIYDHMPDMRKDEFDTCTMVDIQSVKPE